MEKQNDKNVLWTLHFGRFAAQPTHRNRALLFIIVRWHLTLAWWKDVFFPRKKWHYNASFNNVSTGTGIAWTKTAQSHDPYGAALQWRDNGPGGVSNHKPHDCLLRRLFGRRWRKTSKLRVTSLWAGKSPVTGDFVAQRASNAENVSIWWRHHGTQIFPAQAWLLLWLLLPGYLQLGSLISLIPVINVDHTTHRAML